MSTTSSTPDILESVLDLISVLADARIDNTSQDVVELNDQNEVLSQQIFLNLPIAYHMNEVSDTEKAAFTNSADAAIMPFRAVTAEQERLAAEWCRDAFGSNLRDQFAKLWIALDILVPKSGGNFRRRCNDTLAAAFYKADPTCVAAYVDWLYEMRNNLFHAGVSSGDLALANGSLRKIARETIRRNLGLSPSIQDADLFGL